MAARVPLPATLPPPPTSPPLSLRDTQEWIDALRESRVVDDTSLQEFQSKVDELTRRSAREQMSEHGLEAADSLRQEMQASVRSLAAELDAAGQALGTLERSQDPAERGRAAQGLASATARLDGGRARPDAQLRSRLGAAVRTDPRRLDAAEVQALRQRTLRSAGFCKAAIRDCRPGDRDCIVMSASGTGASGTGGDEAGRGGVTRGGATAPLTVDPAAQPTGGRAADALPEGDLRHAGLGEMVGEGVATPEARRDRLVVQAGGAAARGGGGDAVTRAEATPEERAVLERFFK
jgi:hypothetical protein